MARLLASAKTVGIGTSLMLTVIAAKLIIFAIAAALEFQVE